MTRFRPAGFAIAAALAAVVAIPVTLFQLDRAARENSALVELVPAGLAGFADERRVSKQFAENPASAEALAEGIVAHRPVDGSHLAQVALLAVERGNADLAARALSEAAQRGWRNDYVQISVLAAAALQGQPQQAALRLDALSRTEADDKVIFRAIEALLMQPETARELGPLIAQSDFLARAVIRFTDKTPGRADDVARLVEQLGNPDDALGCEGRARLGYGLLTKGNPLGEKVWPSACRDGSQSSLSFAYAAMKYDPAAWVFPKSGSVSLRMREEGRMTVENRDFLRRLVAWKFLTLQPGNYMLSVSRADNASATPTGRRRAEVFASVRCLDRDGREARTVGDLVQGQYLQFTTDGTCPVQRLRIEVGRGRVDDLRLDLKRS